MNQTQGIRFYLILFLSSWLSFAHASVVTWIDPPILNDIKTLGVKTGVPTSPPREYFSLNGLYLGNKTLVQIGYDLINQNYVILPSPNVQRVEHVGDKQYVYIQEYYPELEDKVLSYYQIPANRLHYLYITGYEVYDQDGNRVDRIVFPEGGEYRPPQFYSLMVPNNVKVLSFVFNFNGRTAWSDTGINTDLQGLYKNLTEIGVNRDNSIHLEVKPGTELKTYEVLTSNENEKLQQILSDFHHIVVWGRIAKKDDIINKIIDLKNFDSIDIDLSKGVDELRKYPQLFGDPLDPKYISVINHISSERLTESEMSSESSVSAKLGLDKLFSFGGDASKKKSSRLKEMVKFDIQGSIYIPKSLHFTIRKNETFEVIKSLVFQAYDQLEEAIFRIGVSVSLDQSIPRTTIDHLYQGEKLLKGESLYSTNGLFQLIMQDDGNLVLYRIGGTAKEALWSTLTGGKAVSHCIMQPDGNLVLYSYGNFLWHSGTYSHPGAYLKVQNDGNVVIYQGDKPLWWTKR